MNHKFTVNLIFTQKANKKTRTWKKALSTFINMKNYIKKSLKCCNTEK
jgi:hypothetical protein